MRVTVVLSVIWLVGCVDRPPPSSREAAGAKARMGGRFYALTDGGEQRPLALRQLTVRATMHPGTVRSHLLMEIAGPPVARVEAKMRLPMPRGAAVTRAVLWIDDHPVDGAFVERERAQAIYGAIVARRRDPAIVTWDGPGWLAVSIFPLERGEARRFELDWVEPAEVGAGGQIEYRVPTVSEQGQLVGRALLEVDGRPVEARGGNLVALAAAPASVVVGRAPGDPFARVLVRGQPAAGAARVAIIAETSAAMTAAERGRQHAEIGAVLAGLPAEARVSLLASDWNIDAIAEDVTPAAAAGALAKLDAVVSAGTLHLGRALAAVSARVQSGRAGAVLFVGRGTDAFGDDAVRAPLDAFRRTGAALSAVTVAGLPWPLADAAALTGGEAIAAPVDADGLAALLRALGPPPSRPLLALRGIEDWRRLETTSGQALWIGRALGAAPALDAGVTVPVDGDAADLLALWDRARLPWFDAVRRPRVERTSPAALTPTRALLVLEGGKDSVLGNDASDVLGGLVGNQADTPPAKHAAGLLGTGVGGSGYGSFGLGGRRSRQPEVIPGEAEVRGSLQKELVRRAVRRHINEVRYCYEQAREVRSSRGGRIVVQFTVGASGTVIASTLLSSTLSDASTDACIVAALKRWEFPAPPDGHLAIVRYPFEFFPRGDAPPPAASAPEPPPGDAAVIGSLLILAEKGPLADRVGRVATLLDLPETADAEGLAWTIDRSQADVDLIVLVARLLVAAGRIHDAVRVLSERAVTSPERIAAELGRIGQEAEAAEVLRAAPAR
jgi:TonB family protein